MCKEKHWEGIHDEMFVVRNKCACCKHLLLIYRILAFLFMMQALLHSIID